MRFLLIITAAIVFTGCGSEPESLKEYETYSWDEDIQELYVSQNEVESIIGQEVVWGLTNGGANPDSLSLGWKAFWFLVAAIILFIVFVVSSENYDEGGMGCALVGGLVLIVILIVTCFSSWNESDLVAQRRQHASELRAMWDDIDRLNQTLAHIHVVDQLASAGNDVQIDARREVIQAIRTTRENLVKAFKTATILRENPDFDRKTLGATAISPVQGATELSDRAGDLADALNSAIEIDMRANEKIKQLLATGE